MTSLLRALAYLGLVSGACRATPRTVLTLGVSEVRRVERAPRGQASWRGPSTGDWSLHDGALRVTVLGNDTRRRRPPGTVTQALFLDAPERETVRTLMPVVHAEGRLMAEIDRRFDPTLFRGVPALRERSRVRRGGVSLDIERVFWIEAGRGALRVRTMVHNVGTTTVAGLRWGARLDYGSATPFAPTLDAPPTDREGRAPWVGLAQDGVASAYSITPLDALYLRRHEDRHEGVALSAETDALGPALPLAPGVRSADEALLVLREGGLDEVAQAIAEARGERVIRQRVRVLGADRATATVHVVDNAGRVVMRTDAARGSARIPMRPGRYQAWVSAPGYTDGDPVALEVTPQSSGELPLELTLPPGGTLRVTAVDDATGHALPVRITVRGVAPQGDPVLGPNHRGAGAGPVVVAATGHAFFNVPPGRYRVTVSHGPEWTLSQQDVTVTPTTRAELDARLSRAISLRDWIPCDLHVHAAPSFDSAVTLEDRVASLVAEGVRFATPTEHNVVGGYLPGVAVLPPNVTEPLGWVPAVEVTTDQSASPFGHFNIFPYPPDLTAPAGGPPPWVDVAPGDIFRAARRRDPGAIIQVNHPRMQPNIGYFEVMGLDPATGRARDARYDATFDAIEVFNGFYLNDIAAVERVLGDYMGLLSAGGRYVATGSSDSHAVAFQWAGYPRTYVHLPGAAEGAVDTAAVLRALREGRAFATSGPMLLLTVDGHEPGDPLRVTGTVTARARVQVFAAPWVTVREVTLWRDGQRAATLDVPVTSAPLRLDREVSLELSPGSYVLATARGAEGSLEMVLPRSRGTPYAFTNPVHVEAETDAAR
ncbi:MAG: CehA/McbA family metallohydrolase [Polyangiales bacterium]